MGDVIIQRKKEMYSEKNIPIQLCNICNTQGEITPRWFRFEDEEHAIHTVRVNRIVSRKEINYVGVKMLQFICGVMEEKADEKVKEGEDAEHLVEIRYNIATHRWIFYQVLV